MNWVKVGQQSPINIKRVSDHFHALGSLLHTPMPKQNLEKFGVPKESESSEEKFIRLIEDALAACSEIAGGSIMFHVKEQTHTFKCICGDEITRTIHSFENSIIASCLNPRCEHTYQLMKKEERTTAYIRAAILTCPHCSKEIKQAIESVVKLNFGSIHATNCRECGEAFSIVPTFRILP